MSSFKLTNATGLLGRLSSFVTGKTKELEDIRRQATQVYVNELIKNIPVWTGDTVRSTRVNNDGSKAPIFPLSQSTGFPTGRTRGVPLGAEKQRPNAERAARAQVALADYSIKKSIFITVNSRASDLVAASLAPNAKEARNKQNPSNLAAALVRARFPSIK